METKKILYFDDEMSLAKPLVENLKRKGLNIKLVSTIHDLFNELKNDILYNLIILDIMAPLPSDDSVDKEIFSDNEINQMNNGLETGKVLFSRLRKVEKHQNIPILFYSAKRIPSISVVNTYYIRKPELASEIFKKIETILSC